MTPQDYEDTFHYIKRNIETITQFANEHAIKENLLGMLDEYRNELDEDDISNADELDYWFAYGERVDLNYVSRNLTTIKCFAYPVVNAVPNYDQEYELELPVSVTETI